jgi:hypothetical protein
MQAGNAWAMVVKHYELFFGDSTDTRYATRVEFRLPRYNTKPATDGMHGQNIKHTSIYSLVCILGWQVLRAWLYGYF